MDEKARLQRNDNYRQRGVRIRALLNLGAGLKDSESAKIRIANQEHWKDSMKEIAVFA